MTENELLKEIIRITDKVSNFPIYNEYGNMIFKLFTEKGLPPDMSLEELDKTGKFNKDEKLAVVIKYLDAIVEHKLKSGLGEKGLKRIQEHNRKIFKNFLETGEIGLY